MRNRRALLLPALCGCMAGCMVGPDYHRPDAPVSARFKEAPSPPPGWAVARPADLAPRGEWWRQYGDPVLDDLEARVEPGNQTLRAAEAAFRQAVALADQARAQLFPTVALNGSGRYGNSGGGITTLTSSGLNSGLGTTGAGGAGGLSTGGNTLNATTTGVGNGLNGGGGGGLRPVANVAATVNWELDLWGRIRRQVESQEAAAQASAADVAAARLSAQAQLAIDYFGLRAADELAAVLRRTVADYERSLTITRNQYRAGVVARADAIVAETQLLGARSQLANAGIQRAALEHAIAILAGMPPAALSLPPGGLPGAMPPDPPAVPSALLQRRPDIAAAERAVQQRNALIGVAVAAYYPTISLSALYGAYGNPLQGLFSAGNRLWSLGAAASETVFQGGARSAQVAAARAGADAAVADYRQTVLAAFGQVEDQLAALRILGEQAEVLDRTVALARQSVLVSSNQYRAGFAPYTAVVTQQAVLLADEQAALAVRQNRFVASVTLVEALGGAVKEKALTDLRRAGEEAARYTDPHPVQPEWNGP